MRRQLALAVMTTLGVAVLLSACAPEEIVLARVPHTKDAGEPGEEKRCVDDIECGPKAFCERKRCGDEAGICAAFNFVCEDEPSPVCGCDGITYWNDCLRRGRGITAMRPGQCDLGDAQACKPVFPEPPAPGPEPKPDPNPSGCPARTFCALLLPPTKPDPAPPPEECPFVPGTCWALPAVCPSSPGPDRWTPCSIPVPVSKCTTTCDAIRSGQPHRRATACL